MNWITRMQIATHAFREAYVTAELLNEASFESYEGRLLRYDIAQAWMESTAFRQVVHSWVPAYKTSYSLYKAIRNIYNPTQRLVTFWQMMLYGGVLDPKAGEEGAIPIITENANLRPAIAQLWKDSNWFVNKDLLTMWGPLFGDVAIKIVDDTKRSQVRLQVINPKTVRDVTLDATGFCKGYILEEPRIWQGKQALYREECTHTEGTLNVNFATFKDGKPWPWNGVTSSWSEDYGFVPFVMFQHIPTGGSYGWAELHTVRAKLNELEDGASKLRDYIRKAVDPVWLFNFRKPVNPLNLRNQTAAPTSNNPNPEREEVPAIYAGTPDAKAQPLVTNLIDVEKVSKETQNLIAELERDFPELQMDIWTVGGYTTGKALRTARQRAERKVILRRPSYDQPLVRAQQMAIAIGGMRGYDAYKSFDLASYKAGKLDHSVPSDRPIFDTDKAENVQTKKVFWDIVAAAEKQGLNMEVVLSDLGWSKAKISDYMAKRPSKPVKPTPTDSGQTPPDTGAQQDVVTTK